MNMSEFDQPKISSNVKNKIELGKIPIASQKDTLIVISNKGYTDLIVDDVSANSPYVEISSKSFTLPSGAGSNKNIFISKGTRSN